MAWLVKSYPLVQFALSNKVPTFVAISIAIAIAIAITIAIVIMSTAMPDQTALMREILDTVKALQQNQTQLAANVDAINGRVNILAGIKEVQDVAATKDIGLKKKNPNEELQGTQSQLPPIDSPSVPSSDSQMDVDTAMSHSKKSSVTSRIILT